MSNRFFIVIFILFLSACSGSRQVKKVSEEKKHDNIWLNGDTVQISVDSFLTEDEAEIPIVMRREETCRRAADEADLRLIKLYPEAAEIRPEKRIYYTMYLEDGGCRMIVHYSASGFKGAVK